MRAAFFRQTCKGQRAMYTKDKTGIVMVGRAMEILDYLAGKDKPVGISEMAKDLSLPKATVFRLLN